MELGNLKRFASAIACIWCIQAAAADNGTSCELGRCITALHCPVVRPALALGMPNTTRSVVIDLIKQHRCGRTESVCCTDLAVDLINNNILGEFANGSSVQVAANLMTRPCGVSSGSDLILNGETAFAFEFPWMALLEFLTPKGRGFMCGGSLINDRYVLTAAHCMLDLQLVSVRLGEYDTSTEPDCDHPLYRECLPPAQDFGVDDVIIHKDFRRGFFQNDIALIRLKERVTFGDRIIPICLPILKDRPEDIGFAEVAGWGLTAGGKPSNKLQKATVPVLTNDFCEKLFARRLGPLIVCAGGREGSDTCKGDSGGPLFYRAKNHRYRFAQYGVLSAGGLQCGGNNTVPSVYTKVEEFIPWIVVNLRP